MSKGRNKERCREATSMSCSVSKSTVTQKAQ